MRSTQATERRGPPRPASEPPAREIRQKCAEKEEEEEDVLADLLELEACGMKVERHGWKRHAHARAEDSISATAATAKAAASQASVVAFVCTWWAVDQGILCLCIISCNC